MHSFFSQDSFFYFPSNCSLIHSPRSNQSSRSSHFLNTISFILQKRMDAGIAGWNVKRLWDSVRPITALQCYYAGKTVKAWKGPYMGIGMIDGSNW